MDAAALSVSLVALAISVVAASRQLRLARHANNLPVLVELFKEHRGHRLTEAREFVFKELSQFQPDQGLSVLPGEKQILARDLAWYYDNLGALVAHDVIDIEPVSGYLGGTLLLTWERLEPFVESERRLRPAAGPDQQRWQQYFENLVALVREVPPPRARAQQRLWRL